MHASMLDVLRCPFCGTGLSVVENDALVMEGDELEEGVLGCECCAYPVVAGIPVMLADEPTRRAMHALEDGRREEALLALLGLADDPARQERLRELLTRDDATYREGLELLCDDAEGTWFLYHFSDPTYIAAEALLRGIAQRGWPVRGRTLDLCGGSGHLARVLEATRPADAAAGHGTVLADVWFWKLWLGRRFVVPEAEPVCCDANQPLPFVRASFATVLLADAFPYIWHKRLLAEEMMRLAGPDGVVVMPHLHSALGENFSAGDTLSPAAYQALFEPMAPRLFSDARMLDDVLERRVVDLTRPSSAEALGTESTLTLVASTRADLYRRYDVPETDDVHGALVVNPLYRVERSDSGSVLTLEFPSPEYEAEFGSCRRYMPERVTVAADLGRRITRASLAARYDELRAQRVLLDLPPRYCTPAAAASAPR